MSGMENILPSEYQFDTALDEVREPLVDDLFDAKKHLKDIINPIQEFSQPYFELWQISGFLSGMLKAEDESVEEVRTAVYRAMAFGFQTVNDIKSLPMQTLTMRYITEIFNYDDPIATLHEDVNDYLDERPSITSLIYAFKPEIDETYNYGHHVETSAGLVFMLCERAQAEIYLKVRGDELNQETV